MELRCCFQYNIIRNARAFSGCFENSRAIRPAEIKSAMKAPMWKGGAFQPANRNFITEYEGRGEKRQKKKIYK